MLERFRELAGFDLAELAGARIAGEIPMGDGLANRLIAQQLQVRATPVEAVTLEVLDADVVLAHVRMRAAFVPRLTVHLRIDQQPTFPDSPVLVLRWSLGAIGALARFASPALSLFNVLPPGVRVDGDLIGIDIAEVLRAKDLGDVLPLITRLTVHTQSGRILLGFELRNRTSGTDGAAVLTT